MYLTYSSYIVNSIPRYTFFFLVYGNYKFESKYLEIKDKYYLITSKIYLKKLMIFLYLDLNTQYKIFSDLVGVDFPYKKNRFQLIYNILSTIYYKRVFISFFFSELSKIKSSIDLFPSANWYEREVWDLFGIHFYGNNDLRRILTDYGFIGHPFRKDYPLSGYNELLYNYKIDSILEKPITLIQEFRMFDTISPWSYWTNVNLSKSKLH